MWESKSIDIGVTKEKSKKEIEFTYNGELPKIKEIYSSCGCSSPKLIGNKIVVTYSSGTIPVHLLEDFYHTTKTVTVYYQDGTKEFLSFSTKVVK